MTFPQSTVRGTSTVVRRNTQRKFTTSHILLQPTPRLWPAGDPAYLACPSKPQQNGERNLGKLFLGGSLYVRH